MKKLIHFNSDSNYQNYKDSINTNSIVFIKDTNKIVTHGTEYQFQKWSILDSKYEFVDLGLPSGIKWADRNVGANSPEEVGLYFAWGELQGYATPDKSFDWANYELCNGTEKTLTKYCNLETYGTVDNLTELELVDDASYQDESILRYPSFSNIQELLSNTTSTGVSNYNGSGINGRIFTSKHNGNSIFWPASGGMAGTAVSGFNQYGYMLGRNLKADNPRNVLDYYWGISGSIGQGNIPRCYGLPIRPILNK